MRKHNFFNSCTLFQKKFLLHQTQRILAKKRRINHEILFTIDNFISLLYTFLFYFVTFLIGCVFIYIYYTISSYRLQLCDLAWYTYLHI